MRSRTKVSLVSLREWFKMADILDESCYDSELDGIGSCKMLSRVSRSFRSVTMSLSVPFAATTSHP